VEELELGAEEGLSAHCMELLGEGAGFVDGGTMARELLMGDWLYHHYTRCATAVGMARHGASSPCQHIPIEPYSQLHTFKIKACTCRSQFRSWGNNLGCVESFFS